MASWKFDIRAVYFRPITWALVVWTCCSANAQTAPDAGLLLQELQKQAPRPLPPRQAPGLEPPPLKAPSGGATVAFEAFRFAGNTLFSDAQLAEATRGFLHRPLDFAQMQNVAITVARVYRDAGWVVRAYLPQQEIQGGVLTIQVVEAVFGAARVQGELHRIDPARVRRMAEGAQRPGTPVSSRSIDRAILLADDLPGVSVTGRLDEGSGEAQTDLVLDSVDESLVAGFASTDNAGSRATGRSRALASLGLNSPARLGDLASLTAMHSRGSDFLRLAYGLPVGNQGLRVGLNAAHLHYRVVTPEFSALDVNGSSDAVGLSADYPLLRARTRNLYGSLALERKRFDNRSGATVTTRYGVNGATAGLSGNLFDEVAGGGANTASIAWTHGVVDLADSPNQAADAATLRTAGSFDKLTYELAREQALAGGLSLYASLSGQWAGKNLDSSEKFVLGGPSGVRAYPVGEGSGSEGRLWTLEARWLLPRGLRLKGFYDRGSVRLNRRNDIAGAVALNRYSLAGAGLSLDWTGASGIRVSATVAHRIGSNPNPTPSGMDQDGSLLRTHWWLQLGIPF